MLGALPDTLIVGVSGLGGGSAEEVQHELAVGIGTLAGSTVRSPFSPLCRLLSCKIAQLSSQTPHQGLRTCYWASHLLPLKCWPGMRTLDSSSM